MSTVAVVTSDHSDEDWVFRAIDGALVVVDSAPLADVLVISADCLAPLVDLLPAEQSIVVIGDPNNPPERAVHVVTRGWPDDQLRTLLTVLAMGVPNAEPPLVAPTTPAEARTAQLVIAAARKLGGIADLLACETAIVEILIELIEVDRAYCVYYDHSTGSLWSEAKANAPAGDDRRAAAGLAGFAARTGGVALAASAGDDPRFVGAIDDPNGDPSDHLIAQPVYGSDGAIHAVMVCARRARRPEFGPRETAVLGRFARLVTSTLDQLSIDVHAQSILDDAAGDDGLFRKKALEAQGTPRWGEVVRVSPGWLSFAYWLLVLLLAGSVVFIALGTVATYSSGPAVIRSNAITPVSARTAGNIAIVEVQPGDRAEPGTVIARLDDSDQRASVDRLSLQFEKELRAHMLDLSDASPAAAAVRNVRQELERERVALGERLIVANSAGVVGDIRVRTGQRVAPGDLVASIVDSSKGLELIALLPGEDRPQLTQGQTIRLELTGYRYLYQSIPIESVQSEVISPVEARRVLGAEVADSIKLTGPVVIVRGRITTEAFEVDGKTYRYHDGMLGTAEVRVRSEPIVFALIPGTRRLGE